MAWETSPSRFPARICSMPFSKEIRVASRRAWLWGLILPTPTVAAVSPTKPSRVTPTSMPTMSPAFKIRLVLGIPCTTSSFTEAQMVAWYPRYPMNVATFMGYRGYQATICASVNEEVVHGIPSTKRILKAGDIVGIDVGVTLEGFVGDTAATVGVGKISPQSQALLDATRISLEKGIEQMRAGNRLGDVSHAIQAHAESKGYGVVRDFVGHGIG